MGELIRTKDWSATPLGPPDTWPQCLRTTLSIILHSGFPMFLWWGVDLICFYNDAYRPSLGQNGKHPSILGMTAEEAWPEIWHIIKPLIDQVLAGGEATWSDDQLIPIFRNGQIEDVYWTFSYSPVIDETGQRVGVFVTCMETTEKVRVVSELEKRENQFKFTLDAAELATWGLNPATNRFVGNERLKEWFGLAPHEEIDLDLALARIEEQDRQRAMDAIRSAIQPGSNGDYEIEYWIGNPKGERRRLLAKGKAVFDERGIATRFSGILQDITARAKIEQQYRESLEKERIAREKLEESEKRFRNIVQQAPLGIAIFKGADFVAEMANENYLQIIDRKESPFVGRPLFDSLPEVREAVEPLMKSVLNSGIPFYGTEFPVTLRRYGRSETTWFNFVYDAVRAEDGTISGVIVVAMEVTELKHARHKLAESEKQFRSMVMQSPIPMTIVRGDEMVIETANTVMLRDIWRLEESKVIGKKLLEVFPELNDQKYPALLEKVRSSRQPHREYDAVAYVQGSDGMKRFYLDYEYAPLLEPDGSVSGIFITVNDVTEKLEARLRVEESERKLNVVIDASELGTWELNLKTGAVQYSDRYLQMLGYPPQTRLEHTEILRHVHPDDLPVRKKAFEKAFETGYLHQVTRVIWNDGSIHWVEGKGRVFYDESDTPELLVGTLRDITEEKNSTQHLERLVQERTVLLQETNEKLETSIQDLKKMNAELQSFAYVSSHDLQEPLRKIQTFADRIQEKESANLSDTGRDFLNRMQDAARRMQTLIEDLLMYSRTNTTERIFKKTDLFDLIEEVKTNLRETLLEKQGVIHIGEMPVLHIIPFQFSQLMHNLIGNALKFSKRDVPPVIDIRSEIVRGDTIQIPGFIPLKKEYCHLTVADNGIGFSPEYKERIFEVFQRLHGRSEYKGTGIGLAIVKKIVQNHFGFIEATGEEGAGARFDLYIPMN